MHQVISVRFGHDLRKETEKTIKGCLFCIEKSHYNQINCSKHLVSLPFQWQKTTPKSGGWQCLWEKAPRTLTLRKTKVHGNINLLLNSAVLTVYEKRSQGLSSRVYGHIVQQSSGFSISALKSHGLRYIFKVFKYILNPKTPKRFMGLGLL